MNDQNYRTGTYNDLDFFDDHSNTEGGVLEVLKRFLSAHRKELFALIMLFAPPLVSKLTMDNPHIAERDRLDREVFCMQVREGNYDSAFRLIYDKEPSTLRGNNVGESLSALAAHYFGLGDTVRANHVIRKLSQ